MKHLFSTWAILLFALFIVVPNSFATKRKAQHVVLIGLDGWGAYSVEKADIPNIKNVMANGAYTLKNVRHSPRQAPLIGPPCLWEPVPNYTAIPNGDPKRRNFRHAN